MKHQTALRSIVALFVVNSAVVSFNINSSPSSLSNNNLFHRTATTNNRSTSLLYSTLRNNNSEEEKTNSLQQQIRNACLSLALSCTIIFTPNPNTITSAADYGSLTDQQKAVAEAWRIVDNNYIDRTFNNQDWFQIRQDVVKKKYKSNQEAMDTIDKFVSSLGDKYTRYLPPAKYRSIVDSATGTLAGIGVEISVNKDTSKIYVSDVEPSSPALNGRYTFFIGIIRKRDYSSLI